MAKIIRLSGYRVVFEIRYRARYGKKAEFFCIKHRVLEGATDNEAAKALFAAWLAQHPVRDEEGDVVTREMPIRLVRITVPPGVTHNHRLEVAFDTTPAEPNPRLIVSALA